MVSGAPRRQPPEDGPLKADQPVAPGIASPDQVGEPAAIGRQAVEVGAAAQHQGLGDGALEMAVLALDGAVLVRDAQVVAGRLHAVVAAQRLVTPGLILGGVAVEVAEGGGEAVGAVLDRGTAERPERVLQATSERREALAAKHRLGMLPAGVGEDEVVEAVREGHPAEADRHIADIGEVRQALLSRRMVLAEDDLALRAMLAAPGADPALQGAPQPVPVAAGVAQLHLLQQRDRPQARAAEEQRQHVALPEPVERIDRLSPARALGRLLRRRPGITLDPTAGALADAAGGGSSALGMVMAGGHVQFHLLVGGGASGHVGPAPRSEGPILHAHAATKGQDQTRPPLWPDYGRATPALRPAKPANLRVADRPRLLSRESQHLARRPVHYRDQVEEAAAHRQVGIPGLP